MLNRYLVFFWVKNPKGGIKDFIGHYNDLVEAQDRISFELSDKWDPCKGHIIDTLLGEVTYGADKTSGGKIDWEWSDWVGIIE